jgi:hypothetical protein
MTPDERLQTAIAIVTKLGKARAVEASFAHNPPIENPLGGGYTGVDLDGSTYRARIGIADALSGIQRRITLGRSKDPNDCAYFYRVAHIALWGTFSWANDSLTTAEKYVIDTTRRSMLA